MMAKFIYDEGVNSISLVLLRCALSLPFLAFLGFRTQKSLRIPAKAFPSISLMAIVGGLLTPLLLFSSYRYIASGTATIFHFIYPAVVVLLNFLFLKERFGGGRLISVLLCVLGIGLFYNPGEPLNLRGSLLALLSGVAYAAYILLLSSFRHKSVSGFVLNFYVTTISTSILLIICLSSGQLALPVSLQGWALCLLFALTINVCAAVLFQQGTFLIGGQSSSILSTMEPITSVFLGALLFQEALSFRTLLGSALVIAASILIAVFDLKSSSEPIQP